MGTFSQKEIDYMRETEEIKNRLDWNSYIADARKRIQKEAREEGLEEGLFITARNALAKGIPVETIQEITGLSIDKIKELQ